MTRSLRIPHVEQIGKPKHTTPSPAARRQLKRRAARLMRRSGRLLLDDAPARLPLRGWID
jgi:hypothetical protein